ncbi:MAG: hypothetical protein WAQ22_01825 [Candidatus Saccharimonas sp.]
MKLSTKQVTTLLVTATVAAALPGISQLVVPKKKRESQFDKLLQRHDRKGELRAEILGMSAYEFRQLRKTKSFDDIIVAAGLSKRAFRMALVGWLRNDLKQRGWSSHRIDRYVLTRATRMV